MIPGTATPKTSVLLDVSVTPAMWNQLQRALILAGDPEGYASVNDLVVEAINKELIRLQRGYSIHPNP